MQLSRQLSTDPQRVSGALWLIIRRRQRSHGNNHVWTRQVFVGRVARLFWIEYAMIKFENIKIFFLFPSYEMCLLIYFNNHIYFTTLSYLFRNTVYRYCIWKYFQKDFHKLYLFTFYLKYLFYKNKEKFIYFHSIISMN